MNTLGWGPHGWDMMFLMAIDAFTRKDPDTGKLMFLSHKTEYVNFYTFISARVYPCVHCRKAWMAFNDPENRHCINGCWGSILSFFLEIFPYKPENKNDNVLVLWLYIMKNKVTKKLSVQEDEKMREEIGNYFKNNPDDAGKINDSNFLARIEKMINDEKNIKRIDRSKVTYHQVLEKYTQKYYTESQKANYFPYLFAIAFNAGWSDETDTSIRRIRINTICEDYMTFFACLAKLAPTAKLREAIADYPCSNAFAEKENKALGLSATTEDDHRLAYWLFNIFMFKNIVQDEKLLPRTFPEVIKRYTRWRVVCTKSTSTLQTCRSATPNRSAPLLTDEKYISTVNDEKRGTNKKNNGVFDDLLRLFK